MKKFILILSLLGKYFTIFGQEDNQGIRFENALSWEEIRDKSKEEGKFIFLDCYATWCLPCKKMDREVYADKMVGNYFSEHFISVKLQIDTSNHDSEVIKSWYPIAAQIKSDYALTSVPTFLFFSPDGSIVHRGNGYKKVDDFLILAKESVTPNKQGYRLLANYRGGERDYPGLLKLIKLADDYHEMKLEEQMSNDYLVNYLDTLNTRSLFSKDNLLFLAANSDIITSQMKIFNECYNNRSFIDSLMNNSQFTFRLVEHVIQKEQVKSEYDLSVLSGVEPDWIKIRKNIAKKYKLNYADRIVLDSQIKWYNKKKDWPNLVKYTVLKFDKYGIDTTHFWGPVNTNNIIWNVILMHSNEKETLRKCLRWMEKVIQMDPGNGNYKDTYANVFYKLGKIKEALYWEEQACYEDPTNTELKHTFENMKAGLTLWD